jgi:WD40 repeat protein/tRNA A-37 threonylcarbamoyl transferase component Bud32
MHEIGQSTDGNSGPRPFKPIQLGRFTIFEEVGRGGFGVVFRALDSTLRREVALKVPRPEMLTSPHVRRRFLREARAAACLEHPGIVPVLEVGPLGPVSFIASAYCPGPTLSRWLKTRPGPVSPRTAARLVLGLAMAVDHAHRRGVLHRDIKPSNILLRFDEPDVPVGRITDFGLAKIADELDEESRSEATVGSPPYMAPEQAAGRSRDIDTRTDIYALGVILYEVLLGQRPFVGENTAETLRLVIESDPIPPRTLRPRLPRDLETIILTCLEKQPSRRYSSALALAGDLERWLAGEPIEARARSFRRLAWRRVRQHPMLTAGTVAMILATTSIIGVLAWSNSRQGEWIARIDIEHRRADRLAQEAVLQRDRAERHLRGAHLDLASQALDSGQIERAQNLLREFGPLPSDVGPTGPSWKLLWGLATRELRPLVHHKLDVGHLRLSPDGTSLYSGDEGGRVAAWDPTTCDLTRAFAVQPGRIIQLVVSPDGRRVASASNVADHDRNYLWVRDTTTGEPVIRIDAIEGGTIHQIGFDPPADRFWAMVTPPGTTGTEVRWFPLDRDGTRPSETSPDPQQIPGNWLYGTPTGRFVSVDPIEGLAIDDWTIDPAHPDLIHWRIPVSNPHCWVGYVQTSRSAAVVIPDEAAYMRPMPAGVASSRYPIKPAPWSMPALSPDGQTLALFETSGTVALITLGSDQVRHLDVGTTGVEEVSGILEFSPDGARLVVCMWGFPGGPSPIALYDVATGRKLATSPGRRDRIRALKFSADGSGLFIASGPTIQRWNLDDFGHQAQPEGHADEAWSVAFSPDSLWFWTGSDDTEESQTIKRWDLASGRLIEAWSAGIGTVAALAVSPDGRLLVSGHLGSGNTARLWDPRDGTSLGHLDGCDEAVRTVAFTRDGKWFATAGDGGIIRIWDRATHRLTTTLVGHKDTVPAVVFTPDGGTLISVSADRSVRIWDVATGRPRLTRFSSEKWTTLAIHPDGSLVATADEDGLIQFLDIRTGRVTIEIESEDRIIRSMAFCREGNELAAAGEAGRLYLWDSSNGQQLVSLNQRSGTIHGLAFAPDGSAIVTTADNGGVRIWPTR